jgi:hypothetical protein
MGNILHIGNAPRLNTHGTMGLMSSENALLKVNLYPRVLAKNGLDQILNSITGVVQMENGSADMKQRATAIAGKFPVAPFDSIVLHCQQSGAITDTYTNTIEQAAILGKLNNTLGSNEFSTMMKQWKQSGLSPAEVVRESVGTLTSIAKNVNLIEGDTAKNVDKGISDVINNTNRYIDMAKNKGTMEKFFMNDLKMDDKSAKIAAALTSQSVAILSGDTPVIPNLWANSSANSVYSFMIRLYNPVPASLDMHHTYIMQPIAYLKALALPASEMGTTEKDKSGSDSGETETVNTGNDRTYSNPLYVEAEAPGLFSCKAGIISNLSIIKGGDENAIAFNGRPIYVDINLTIQPLYNVTIISEINPDTSAVNASTDYSVMHGEDGDGTDPLSGNTDAAQTGNSDTVAEVRSDFRLKSDDVNYYYELTGETGNIVPNEIDGTEYEKNEEIGPKVEIPAEIKEQVETTGTGTIEKPDGSKEIYTVESDKNKFTTVTSKETINPDGQKISTANHVTLTSDALINSYSILSEQRCDYTNLITGTKGSFNIGEELEEAKAMVDAAYDETQKAFETHKTSDADAAVKRAVMTEVNINTGEKGMLASSSSPVKGSVYKDVKSKFEEVKKTLVNMPSDMSGGKYSDWDTMINWAYLEANKKIPVSENGEIPLVF